MRRTTSERSLWKCGVVVGEVVSACHIIRAAVRPSMRQRACGGLIGRSPTLWTCTRRYEAACLLDARASLNYARVSLSAREGGGSGWAVAPVPICNFRVLSARVRGDRSSRMSFFAGDSCRPRSRRTSARSRSCGTVHSQSLTSHAPTPAHTPTNHTNKAPTKAGKKRRSLR